MAHDQRVGRPFKDGETASERVAVVFTPTELETLEELRGDVQRGTFIKKVLREFAVNSQDNPDAPTYPDVPLLGYISAGEGIGITRTPDGTMITPPFRVPSDAYGLIVVGDSMERPSGKGNIPDGSIAIFQPMPVAPDGAVVHAEWRDEKGTLRATIKRLIETEEGALRLIPLNPKRDEPLPMFGFDIKGVFVRAISPAKGE